MTKNPYNLCFALEAILQIDAHLYTTNFFQHANNFLILFTMQSGPPSVPTAEATTAYDQ